LARSLGGRKSDLPSERELFSRQAAAEGIWR